MSVANVCSGRIPIMMDNSPLLINLLVIIHESQSMKDTAHRAHGGTISLISDSSVINYGEITSNGAFGGFINITCPVFKNFGRIEAKNNGQITIQCASFETVSEIHPKPVINTPWEYLVLDAKHQFIQ
eukprot:25447_1